MLGLLREPVSHTRTVEGGRAHCVVKMRMVDLGTCSECVFLEAATAGPGGQFQEIRCAPPIAAMLHGES